MTIAPESTEKGPVSLPHVLHRLNPRTITFWLLISGFAMLALRSYLNWDTSVLETIRGSRHLPLERSLKVLVNLFQPFGRGEGGILLALLAGLCGNRRLMLRILVALVVVAVLVWPFKATVHRERPRGESFVSFPSGDSATATAVTVTLIEEIPLLLPVATAVVGVVALGRVLVEAHYPSDVLFGIALGLAAGFLVPFSAKFRRFRSYTTGRHRVLMTCLGCGIVLFALITRDAEFIRLLGWFGPAMALLVLYRWLSALEEPFDRWASHPVTPVIIAALIAILFLFITTKTTLWDRDEPRFSRAAVEMMQSGSMLVPTFNGGYRLHKPILVYWLMQGPLRVLGQSELAVRSIAVLSMSVVCLLVCRTGTWLWNRRTGVLAMMMLPATPLILVCGTAATTDALLLMWFSMAMVLSAISLRSRSAPINPLGLGTVLGAAQLTKGPVGLAIPLLGIITTGIMNRGESIRKSRFFLPLIYAVVIGCILFLLWFIPANNQTGGEFFRQGFWNHVVNRSLTPREGHGGNFFLYLPYYLVVILVGFFPWTLYLPAAISSFAKRRAGNEKTRAYLIGWTVPLLILMTLVATKLPHYILPAWPALALMTAWVVSETTPENRREKDQLWLRRGVWPFVLVGGILSMALLVAPSFFKAPGLLQAALPSGCVVAVMTVIVTREHLRNRIRRGALLLFAGMLLMELTLASSLMPYLEKTKISPALAQLIHTRTPTGTPVTTYHFLEPTLVYYLDRGVIGKLGSDAAVEQWSQGKGPGVLVIPRTDFRRITEKLGPMAVKELGSVKGLNIAKGNMLDVMALVRADGYFTLTNP